MLTVMQNKTYKKRIIPYEQRLVKLARKLRNNSTFSEVLLWKELKNKQLRGFKFLRQKPIDKYIVDFFCQDLMLAIEIDGITHDYKIGQDKERQKKIERFGITFIRFQDIDIKTNLEGVLQFLNKWIDNFEKKKKVQHK